MCADGYNWAPARGEWTSFEQVFASFYGWAVTTGKPIMIGEFGAQERAAGEKAATRVTNEEHWGDSTFSPRSPGSTMAYGRSVRSQHVKSPS